MKGVSLKESQISASGLLFCQKAATFSSLEEGRTRKERVQEQATRKKKAGKS